MTRNISLLALGLASIALSRITFMLIDDPEGPNLLVVTALAAVIFAVLWSACALVRRAMRAGRVR